LVSNTTVLQPSLFGDLVCGPSFETPRAARLLWMRTLLVYPSESAPLKFYRSDWSFERSA
jgi:hypothetical protein